MSDTQIPSYTPAVVSAGGSLDTAGVFSDSTVEVGVVGPRDLLVRVEAVSVNPVDAKVRRSQDPESGGRILGWDASGVVEQIGPEVIDFAPGDEVFYAGSITKPGTNQKYHVVDSFLVGHKPTSLTFEQAAALPLTTLTAWEALFDKLRLTADSEGTLVVLGAAGGVGSILIQLAHQLTKLTVIALASRAESTEWVRQLGADHVVDYTETDDVQQVKNLAPAGVDYLFTGRSVGQVPFIVEVMRPFGEVVAIDEDKDLDIMALKPKALSWHWEYMFARPMHNWDPQEHQRVLNMAARLVDSGTIHTTVTTILNPINAQTVAEAHRIIESGHALGKVVVAGW